MNMTFFNVLYTTAFYISEALVFYFYAHQLFEEKHKNRFTVIFTFVGYACLLGLYFLDKPIINAFALIAINIFLFKLLFQCNIKSAIFHTAILLVIMSATEIIAISFLAFVKDLSFPSYRNNEEFNFIAFFLSKLLYTTLCVLISKILSKNKRPESKNKFYWLLFILPLSSVFIILIFAYFAFEFKLTEKMNYLITIAGILILLTNILIFFIYEHSTEDAYKLYELQTEKNKQQIDREYLDVLEHNNKELKIFTHDIKNQLEQIALLTENTEVQSYVEKLYGRVREFDKVAYTNNRMLNIILSKYVSLCSSKNIHISLKTMTADLSMLDEVDLCTIMSNILDNAAEAAEKSKTKTIDFNLYTKNNFEIIRLNNSCDTAPSSDNDMLITTKHNKTLHGLGIRSVEKTLKKYDGIYNWSYNEEQHIFETTIIIPKQ